MKLKSKYTIILALCGGFSAFGQSVLTDSIHLLKTVSVIETRTYNFIAGSKLQEIDSLATVQHSHQNLANLLADESPIFIKSYGLGSLATSSFRGGSANHTAVLWNGFNISSPMNGQLDLSLVPGNLASKVTIQYGGGSALWGSGAIGGTIHLNNTAKFGNGITVKGSLSGGSFGTYNQQFFAEFSQKRFVSSIKLFHSSAQNNFTFNNTINGKESIFSQTHAELKNIGIVVENYLTLNDNNQINLCAWVQKTARNLPPTLLQWRNTSEQTDEVVRITANWHYQKSRHSLNLRSAYFNEYLLYSDTTYAVKDKSRSNTGILEAEYSSQLFKNLYSKFGIINTVNLANTPTYDKSIVQNRFALWGALAYSSKSGKIKLSASGRQELLNAQWVPFTFTSGGEFKVLKWLILTGNLARVYRIPTLNDLYWFPGGNPDLQAEKGFSEEVGINVKHSINKIEISNSTSIYNRNINNWIIWMPGPSFWAPHNLASVWSRGVETNTSFTFPLNKVRIRINVITNYVLSTNQNSTSEFDASLNKQLIYVPMYSGMGKCVVEWKQFTFGYRHNYTGYRFTSTDNTQSLNPYNLGAFDITYSIKLKSCEIGLFAQLNNAWGADYQVLLNRPMPLQNFQFGISFQFQKSNQKPNKS